MRFGCYSSKKVSWLEGSEVTNPWEAGNTGNVGIANGRWASPTSPYSGTYTGYGKQQQEPLPHITLSHFLPSRKVTWGQGRNRNFLLQLDQNLSQEQGGHTNQKKVVWMETYTKSSRISTPKWSKATTLWRYGPEPAWGKSENQQQTSRE